MPITNNVVGSNPVHGEVYSIQRYVVKFVSDLRQVGGFFLHQKNWPPRYNWNIVESDVEHHKPTNQLFVCFCYFFVCVGNHERSNMKNAM
jgi:hypothetical protein